MNLLCVVSKSEQILYSKQNKIYLFIYLFNLFLINFVFNIFMNRKQVGYLWCWGRLKPQKKITMILRRTVIVKVFLLAKKINDLISDYNKTHGSGNPIYTLDKFQDPNFKAVPALMENIDLKWVPFLQTRKTKEDYEEIIEQSNKISIYASAYLNVKPDDRINTRFGTLKDVEAKAGFLWIKMNNKSDYHKDLEVFESLDELVKFVKKIGSGSTKWRNPSIYPTHTGFIWTES